MKRLINYMGVIIIIVGVFFLVISTKNSFEKNQDLIVSGVILAVGLITYILTNKLRADI